MLSQCNILVITQRLGADLIRRRRPLSGANIAVSTEHAAQTGDVFCRLLLSQDMGRMLGGRWLAECAIVHFATKTRVTIRGDIYEY